MESDIKLREEQIDLILEIVVLRAREALAEGAMNQSFRE